VVLALDNLGQRLADPLRAASRDVTGPEGNLPAELNSAAARTAHLRQQSLRAAVHWSYELLSEPDRRLLRQVSVFAGGWTREATGAVCDSPESGTEGRVEDALARLVSKSLVTHAQTPSGESRYSLLETIRAYAREPQISTLRLETTSWNSVVNG
jgi:hypothetical protein